MLRVPIFIAGLLASMSAALADGFHARTPGLWEFEATAVAPEPADGNLPPPRSRIAYQCIDATVDQSFWLRDLDGEAFGEVPCAAPHTSDSAGTITSELSCSVGDNMTMTTQTVASGDFTRAYTLTRTVTYRTEGPQADDATLSRYQVKVTYKYVGACRPDQRPGDFITAAGNTIHLFGGSSPVDQRCGTIRSVLNRLLHLDLCPR